MDPAWYEELDGDPAGEVAALVRLRPGVEPPPGVRVIAHFGDIATVRLARGDVLAIRQHAAVVSLKAPRRVVPEPVSSARLSSSTPRRRSLTGDTAPTGRGVVIGVVDWGVDVTHPNLRRADGRTRLLALWDQRPRRRGSPRPYGYGIAYDARRIDRALEDDDPFRALGYDPVDADGDGTGAHGTHVLDIAAGVPRVGPGGVAPGADLVFVHLAMHADAPRSIGSSVSLLEGIDFIRRVAGERPWVINLSLGSHGGPHDGSTLVEQALDAIVTSGPGRVIVQSCGNYHHRPIHASGRLGAGERVRVDWLVDSRDETPNELEAWYPGTDAFTARLISRSGQVVAVAPPGFVGPIVVGGETVGRIAHRTREPNNGDSHISILLDPEPGGLWHVELEGVAVQRGNYDIWIERDEIGPGSQSRLRRSQSDPSSTTGTICNGHHTIAVGAYDARTAHPAFFSSGGPTRDGRSKPDLLAPGVGVVAARSSPWKDGGHDYLAAKSGTSMAAPHVTGAVALLYESAGRPLTIQEVRGALFETAVSPDGIAADRSGHGRLSIAEAVRAASALRPQLPEAIDSGGADVDAQSVATEQDLAAVQERVGGDGAPREGIDEAMPPESDVTPGQPGCQLTEDAPLGETGGENMSSSYRDPEPAWLDAFHASEDHVCTACGNACGESAPRPAAAAMRILLVGDSHTEGVFGAELERLLRTTGARITRAAESGSAVMYWWKRLPALLSSEQPDVVLIALGANMREYPSAEGTAAQIRRTVRLIAEARPVARIVWIGPPRERGDSEARLQEFNQRIRRGIAGDAVFIDSSPHTPRYEGGDGVHYANAAARTWAAGVFRELESSLTREAKVEAAGHPDREEYEDREEYGDPEAEELESMVAWGFDPDWTPLVFELYKNGHRDRDDLTNRVFYAQGHAPAGHVIDPKTEPALAKKWGQIRNGIVDPALNRLLNAPPPAPKPSGPVVSPLALLSRFPLRNHQKRTQPFSGIVVHTTGSDPTQWAERKSPVCSTVLDCALAIYAEMDGFPHYVIDFQGLIVCVASEDYVAWHAGVLGPAFKWLTENGPPGWWTKMWAGVARSPFDLPPRGRHVDVNAQYIGIELLGSGSDGPYTEAQYRSLAALILDLEGRHGLSLARPPSRSLLGHEDLNPAPSSVGGRSLDGLGAGWDPGASRGFFSWDKLWSLMRGGVTAPAPTPAPAGRSLSTLSEDAPRHNPPPPALPSSPPATSGALTPPADPGAYRSFKLTTYWVADQTKYPTGSIVIPFYDKNGKQIATATPEFYAAAMMEGTVKLTDGRLINVDGGTDPNTWVSVDPKFYAPMLALHKRIPPGLYIKDGGVILARPFRVIPKGYGKERKGIEKVPFRTLAADPRLVPAGTNVFIRQFVGLTMPDRTVHDGWFVVNDTGDAILGAHFDVFTGFYAGPQLPTVGTVWFAGIETRIP